MQHALLSLLVFFFSAYSFPSYSGSATLALNFHSTRSPSFTHTHTSSSHNTLRHVQPLFPRSSASSLHARFHNRSYSFRIFSPPNDPSLFSLISSIIDATFLCFRYSFLILSSLVTPLIHLKQSHPCYTHSLLYFLVHAITFWRNISSERLFIHIPLYTTYRFCLSNNDHLVYYRNIRNFPN